MNNMNTKYLALGLVLMMIVNAVGMLAENIGGEADDNRSPPAISNIECFYYELIGGYCVIWNTDVPATSQVEYGKTHDYGYNTTLDGEHVTQHSVGLYDLELDTTYLFRVKSKNEAGEEAISKCCAFSTARSEGVTVNFTGSTYESATGKTSGWFHTGQDADIMLSGIDFNNTGGPLLFNRPGRVASDDTHLLFADCRNNRVLIWNSLPVGNIAPDIVLGQEDFYSNNPGTGMDQMNWPMDVATDGEHVVVADTENNRILIWNTFPTTNGQAADLVIEGDVGISDPKRIIRWPWGVWAGGGKLVISSTKASSVLIWNDFPIENNQSADIYLTAQGDFGTPRGIVSDGVHLIVGDDNPCGTFFWNIFPTSDDQPYDFFMSDTYGQGQGDFTSDGKLVLLGEGRFHIWNSFPENSSDLPDLSVGEGDGKPGYRFKKGDGSGVVSAGDKFYLSLSNNNNIVGFNSLPTEPMFSPDFAVGASDICTNTLETNYFITSPAPVSDGVSLFVSSDMDRRIYVWKNLPDESNAKPDIVYNLPFQPWDSALFGNTLILTGQDTVCIWETLPRNGELPDMWFNGSIGNVSFQDLKGVALDSQYFYLADHDANKIYVWEGIPDNDTNPKFSLDIEKPRRLSSDGTYLVVASPLAGGIKFYRINELSSSIEPTFFDWNPNLNLPEAALAVDGYLFIADTCHSRVLAWSNISDAVEGSPPDVVLGEEDFNDTIPEIGVDKLFWPAAMSFDGDYLWVGEFKFSGRLLRFSPTEQGNWEKEAGIRVPDGVSSCTIMLPGDTYRMYYTGIDGIYSAFSSDGLTWTVEDGVRVGPGGMGSNQERVCNCAVIGHPGFYRMIYEGVQGELPNDIHRFFSANSTDGLNWTKEEGIRLESEGTSDYGQVSVPDIIDLSNGDPPSGPLRMYYVGDFYHQGNEGNSIRSAISYDFGWTWTREGSRLFDEDTMDPDVIKRGNEYRMFYTASPPGQKPGNLTVYSALSEDGLNWTMELGSRVAPGGAYDMENCMDPDVFELPNGSYRMYYSGMNPGDETNILSALRLPFSGEDNFALDFSESQFNFTYPMDRLYFRFKSTNIGTKKITGGMDECHTEPLNYIHVATPQGTNFLAPGESIWSKIILGAEPFGHPQSPEGTYNFTLYMRFNVHLPDTISADNIHFYVNKTLQIKVVNRTTLAGDVIIQGRIVNENGFPISDLEFDIGTYGGKTGTRTDAGGYFSYSIAESQAYFLIVQKSGYRAVTLEIDGNNIQDFYNITLSKETSPISVNTTLINSVTGNIGFWRCAATKDESKLLLVNGMENWEDPFLINQSKLYLLDVNTGEIEWTHNMSWDSWTADITDDGKYVVFGTNLQWPETGPEGFINFIRLLNGTDGSIIWQKNITSENFPEYFSDGQSYTRGMKFSHSGEYIIVAVEFEYVYLLNRSDGSIKWQKWVSHNIREILFTQDDQYVYISSGNGQLYKVRVNDGSEVWKQWTGAWAIVNGLDLSSDEQHIAVGAKGATLSVINTIDGSIRFSGDGYACRLSPDGTMIAAGGDPALKVLDLDGNLLWRYYLCDSADIRFSGDGSLLFCVSGQVFNSYGTLVHEVYNTQGRSQVGWLNSNATRFIWAVRDTPASENNIIEVYRIERSAETPPAAVLLNTPTEITANSMLLSWYQNMDDDFANYTIYQSTTEGLLGGPIHVITDNTTTSYNVTGLSPITTYYFTVRVYDTGHLYNDSNQVSGTTNPSALPTLVVTVNANSATVNSGENSTITVTVTDGTNPVSGATINLGSDNGGSFSTVTDNGDGTYTATFTAPSITIQTVCRITATASKTGYNDGSGYADVTVNPIVLPPARVTLNAPTSITTSSMTLSWTQNTDNDFANYTIYQSTTSGVPGNAIKVITTNTTTSWTVTGLSPSTTYYFTVRVYDTAGLHNDSNQVSGTTLSEVVELPPAKVTLIAPTSITTNSVLLSWSQNNDSDFANYTGYQSTTSGNIGTAIYAITAQSTTSYTVTGLSSSTTYYFTIRVYDTGSLHNDSNQVSGTTLTAVTMGNLTGTVTDKNGKPIENVAVSIVATSHVTWTDSNGRYTFTDVSASSYGVKAEKSGYETKTETGVVINAGKTRTLDIVLEKEKKPEEKGFIPSFESFILLIALAGCAILLKHRKRLE